MPESNRYDRLEYFDSLNFSELLALETATPDDVDLLVRIGMQYFRRRQLDECHDYYSRALAIDPEDGWTCLYMGNLCYGLGCYRDAISYFQRALELLPDVACPHWCLGDAYRSHGDFGRAEFHYRRAVEIDPEDVKAQQRLEEWIDTQRYDV